MNFNNKSHLTEELLIRSLDDELSTAERLHVESHLNDCNKCRLNLASWRSFSSELEMAIEAVPAPTLSGVRPTIQTTIEHRRPPVPALRKPGNILRRFGIGVGLAAALAFGLVFNAHQGQVKDQPADSQIQKHVPIEQASTIEVNGESFQPVPYSNPDLPLSAPHIVQMQVPVASLADAGIVLEPVVNRAVSDGQASVLADVLVGPDGQPRGVHVLEE